MPDSIDSNVEPFCIARLNPDWEVYQHDNTQYFSNRKLDMRIECNVTAAAIGSLLDDRHTISHIAAELGTIFEVDPHSIVPEISKVIHNPSERGVASFRGTDGVMQRLELS